MPAQGPPQHRGVCPETQRSVTNIQFKTRLIPTPTQSAVTVGVVGINVGIGGVPALDGPVNSAAETLLSGAAHDHTQYGPPVQKHQLRPRVSSYTDLRTGSLFFFFFVFLPVSPERVDWFHVQRGAPVDKNMLVFVNTTDPVVHFAVKTKTLTSWPAPSFADSTSLACDPLKR